MTESLKQNYNITKPRSINLKNITLGWFLLFYVLAPLKNIATSSDNIAHDKEDINNEDVNLNNAATDSNNEAPNNAAINLDIPGMNSNNEAINRDIPAMNSNNEAINRDIMAMNSNNEAINLDIMAIFILSMYKTRNFLAVIYIVDSTCISLYNYFTGHNKRKSKWYLHKFFFYTGRKINITKNFYLDLYFSLLKFPVHLFFFLIRRDVKNLLVNTIQLYINIRIYKNFYLSFNLIGAIQVLLVHIAATFFYHIFNPQIN